VRWGLGRSAAAAAAPVNFRYACGAIFLNGSAAVGCIAKWREACALACARASVAERAYVPRRAPGRRPVSPPLPLFLAASAEPGGDVRPTIVRPRTGISCPIMWPHPQLLDVPPVPLAPLVAQSPTLIDELRRADMSRVAVPDGVINRVVFDCVTGLGSLERSTEVTVVPEGLVVPALRPWLTLAGPDDGTLIFESR
jgi:hypothetical protein